MLKGFLRPQSFSTAPVVFRPQSHICPSDSLGSVPSSPAEHMASCCGNSNIRVYIYMYIYICMYVYIYIYIHIIYFHTLCLVEPLEFWTNIAAQGDAPLVAGGQLSDLQGCYSAPWNARMRRGIIDMHDVSCVYINIYRYVSIDR